MKSIIFFLCLFTLTLASSHSEFDSLWRAFKAQHGKSYNRIEEVRRRSIFESNVKAISHHNLAADVGQHNFRLGINQFADMTNQEFRKRMLTYGASSSGRQQHRIKANSTLTSDHIGGHELPSQIDWRNKDLVVDVKDQGGCGSCWAFSTIASLEGQHAKKMGKLESFSEQQLIDCSRDEGNEGCNGGLMEYAFEYLKKSGGSELEEDYPYTGEDGECEFKKDKVTQKVAGFVSIKKQSEDALQKAVADVGPISVAIDAGSLWFQFYKSGVYDQEGCGVDQEELNHAVTAVGYGDVDGNEYWLVKNSWGITWGDAGYIKMSRNKDNQCGIATDASYPLLA